MIILMWLLIFKGIVMDILVGVKILRIDMLKMGFLGYSLPI
jgi:hypothetical protein